MAHRQVLAGRRVWGWAWTVRRLKMYAYRLDWWLALVVAATLSAPMYGYVGKNPGWLDGGWQVSAVLLGFVIALVVFLLQVVIDRSIRAERTYRAVLSQSRVAWPTAFALVFIAWTAVIERYGKQKATPPSWVVTWSLCFFGAQLLALVAAFGGVRSLLAPAGVIRVLERALRIDIDRGVEERLTQTRARDLLIARFEKVGVTGGPAFGGFDVRPSRAGYVDDFDLKLPRRLKRAAVAEDIQMWWLNLGDKVKPRAGAVASVRKPPTEAMTRAIRSAVSIRKRERGRGDWMEVFGDTIDLGLKAVADGNERDVDTVTDIVAEGFAEVPRAYRRFGEEYNAKTVYGTAWRRGMEDRMATRLHSMSRHAAVSDRPEAFIELVVLPYKLASTAIDDDVELLLYQALGLWHAQAQQARLIASDTLRNEAIDRIHRLSTTVARTLIRTLEGKQSSLDQKRHATSNLRRINSFRARLLRSYVDADDMSSFRGLLGDMTGQSPFDPVGEARKLKHQLAIAAPNDPGRPRLHRELADAEATAQLFTEVVDARSWGWFLVGAWAAWQHLHKRIAVTTWAEVSRRLARPFPSSGIASHLVELMTSRDLTHELDLWNTDTMDLRSSSNSWTPRNTDIALLWATLLLLNETGPGSDPQFEAADVMVYADQLRAEIATIEENSETWTEFVGGDLASKAQQVRDALAEAETLSVQRFRQQVADAPVLDERVVEFQKVAREEFDGQRGLRHRLLAADALTISQGEASASTNAVMRLLMPKSDFTQSARHDVSAQARRLGALAAEAEDDWLYRQLEDISQPVDETQNVVDGIKAAIDSLKACGCSPNAIILPRNYFPGKDMTSARGFRWSEDHEDCLALLDEVEILDVGPFSAPAILVCDVGESIRVSEHAGHDGHPLSTDVVPLDEGLAGEMLDNGHARVPNGKTREEAISELQDMRVLANAYIDWQLGEPSRLRGVRRVAVPSEEQPAAQDAGHEDAEQDPSTSL